jgi:hypothetical protein
MVVPCSLNPAQTPTHRLEFHTSPPLYTFVARFHLTGALQSIAQAPRDFLAELLKHLRTTNLIESAFATVRHTRTQISGAPRNWHFAAAFP